MCLSSSGTVKSCSVDVYPRDWVFLHIYPLQSTVEGILGSEGPAEDDSEAREEAETALVDMILAKSWMSEQLTRELGFQLA